MAYIYGLEYIPLRFLGLLIPMQTSSSNIVIQIVAITAVFLIAAVFLLAYINSYNKKKRKHLEEKKDMQRSFESELVKTRMEVQEQTLQTIAADIHDNVGQLLSLTRISLSTVNPQEEPLKATEKISAAMDLLDTSIKELRQLAAVLHAENLLKSGLPQAFERELERMERTTSIRTRFEINGEPEVLDPHTNLILFRVLQELLNNILKHASASSVHVSLSYGKNYLEMIVIDNGKGFDTLKALRTSNGMGLGNIFKRAKMVNAEFDINSIPGEGAKAYIKMKRNE